MAGQDLRRATEALPAHWSCRENGAKEETSTQEKQAQGLRRAVRKGLWQEKEVQEDVRQLWAVIAKSLGRQQWARESECRWQGRGRL